MLCISGRAVKQLGQVTVCAVSADAGDTAAMQKSAGKFAVKPPLRPEDLSNRALVRRRRWALDPRFLKVHGCVASAADRFDGATVVCLFVGRLVEKKAPFLLAQACQRARRLVSRGLLIRRAGQHQNEFSDRPALSVPVAWIELSQVIAPASWLALALCFADGFIVYPAGLRALGLTSHDKELLSAAWDTLTKACRNQPFTKNPEERIPW